MNGQIESKMIQEFKKAQKKNNNEIIQKLIKDCRNYKAIKLKDCLNKNNVVILVQSVEQANIISNDKNNIIYIYIYIFLLPKLKEFIF